MFGCCKTFSGKYIFSGNANFRKRKIFPCVWLHFKKFSGKYFLVFGKEEGKHKSRKKHKPQPRKKIAINGERGRFEIAIDASRDRAVDRDLAKKARSRSRSRRRTGFVVVDRLCDLGSSSLAVDRDLDPARARRREIASLIASPLACARSLSLSLSHFLEIF